MTKIAIISLSDLSRDPRVYRQISILHPFYEIITAGTKPSKFDDIPFFKLIHNGNQIYQRAIIMKISKDYYSFYRSYANYLELGCYLHQEKPDIIIANDIDMLPVALHNRGKSKVLFDAHEYSPLENNESFLFRMLFKPYRTWLVRKYVTMADSMMTVSDGISEKYYCETGKSPIVVTNSPDFQNIKPSITKNIIRLVHHGAAIPERNLESNIRVMAYLPAKKYELHLYLVPTDFKYLKKLKTFASKFPNVFFHEPVAMIDIAKTINQYDIGVFIVPPVNFNLKYTLPNKFFEFIQARLALATGPSPEMAKIIKANNIGIVSCNYNPRNMAERILELTPEKIQEFKSNSDKVAYDYSAEKNKDIILGMVAELINN